MPKRALWDLKLKFIYFMLDKNVLNIVYDNIINKKANCFEGLAKSLIDPNVFGNYYIIMTYTMGIKTRSFKVRSLFNYSIFNR